jgi:hypothetical protein
MTGVMQASNLLASADPATSGCDGRDKRNTRFLGVSSVSDWLTNPPAEGDESECFKQRSQRNRKLRFAPKTVTPAKAGVSPSRSETSGTARSRPSPG